LEEGIRALLEGRWMPQVTDWSAVVNRPRKDGRWEKDPSYEPQRDLGKLQLQVDEDLLTGLRRRADEMRAESGSQIWPGKVAIQIFRDRLGEPAE